MLDFSHWKENFNSWRYCYCYCGPFYLQCLVSFK